MSDMTPPKCIIMIRASCGVEIHEEMAALNRLRELAHHGALPGTCTERWVYSPYVGWRREPDSWESE